jgi:hypothetical protein
MTRADVWRGRAARAGKSASARGAEDLRAGLAMQAASCAAQGLEDGDHDSGRVFEAWMAARLRGVLWEAPCPDTPDHAPPARVACEDAPQDPDDLPAWDGWDGDGLPF